MSSNLYWRRVPTERTSTRLPFALKKAIAQGIWQQDGSLNAPPASITVASSEYFRGLRDAGVEGAGEVMKLLEEHEAIELFIAE